MTLRITISSQTGIGLNTNRIIMSPVGGRGAQGLPGSGGGQGWAAVLIIDYSTVLPGYSAAYLGSTDAGAIVWTAPTAVGNGGKEIYLENIGASGNLLTVNGLGGQTIEGAASLDLNDGMGRIIYSDGANWRVRKA